MKRDIFNKEVAKDTAFDMAVSGLESLAANTGKALLDNAGLVGDVLMDTGASAIPGIGSAISSFRQNKKISNIERFTHGLAKEIEVLKRRVNEASSKDKENYMELFDFAYESVQYYSQEEKIEMLSNGLINIIETDDVSFDISYLYINTLNRLTLLDLAVVKLFNRHNSFIDNSPVEFESFEDVLNKFGIEYEQYQAIKSNLNTFGLLETQTDKSLSKDLATLEDKINRIDQNSKIMNKDLGGLISGKLQKTSNLRYKNFKIKSKDRYKISKFGTDFYQYFLNSNN